MNMDDLGVPLFSETPGAIFGDIKIKPLKVMFKTQRKREMKLATHQDFSLNQRTCFIWKIEKCTPFVANNNHNIG